MKGIDILKNPVKNPNFFTDKDFDEYRKMLKGEDAPVQKEAAPGRNDLCPCGSGKKYKKCCMDLDKSIIQKLNDY